MKTSLQCVHYTLVTLIKGEISHLFHLQKLEVSNCTQYREWGPSLFLVHLLLYSLKLLRTMREFKDGGGGWEEKTSGQVHISPLLFLSGTSVAPHSEVVPLLLWLLLLPSQ